MAKIFILLNSGMLCTEENYENVYGEYFILCERTMVELFDGSIYDG